MVLDLLSLAAIPTAVGTTEAVQIQQLVYPRERAPAMLGGWKGSVVSAQAELLTDSIRQQRMLLSFWPSSVQQA